ncbi:MAG: chromosome segregation protein SMC [Chloroflexia bacterium]
MPTHIPRLKHLTLQGFKTFAAKTDFAFHGDITAIIGPNGSGKSNVADALRWVLGEQSYSQLRARRSEDLIFSGSTARGQQGMAEVSLTLDNSDRLLAIDYDEVSITRRAFRSGENEYFINRSRVRLRDVQELLAPVGQSFTVVGQGLADELLSLNPTERRALFEEAAGIRPFYAQRDDALKRLAHTEDNMLRVGDLVAELEPQLKSLERQARAAQDYNAVAAELNGLLDIRYGAQWREVRSALAEADAASLTAAASLAEARADADAADRRLAESRSEAEAARAELDRLAGEQAGIQHLREQAARAAAVHAERLAAVEAQQRQTTLEHETGRAALAEVAEQLAEMAAAEQGAGSAEQDLREWVASSDATLARTAAARRTTDRAQSAAQDRAAQSAAHAVGLKQRLSGSQDHRLELERQLAEQQNALAMLDARRRTEAAELADAQAASRRSDAAQTAASEQLAHADAALADAAAAREAAEKRLHASAAEVESLHTRLELARSLSEGGAGLPHAVRAVLGAASLHGIVGPVAGLLVSPQEFETAIEVALGGRINDIVVQTWPDAEAAIAFLKQAGAGRATFLPLDSLRFPSGPADALRFLDSRRGVHGLASSLVETATQYRAVIQQLLGRTIVVDDLPVARRALRRLPIGWSIVTLGGEIVRSGGAVTGGSPAREHGLLARERERRDLASALRSAEVGLAARAADLSSAADAWAGADAARQAAAERRSAASSLEAECSGTVGQLGQRASQTEQEQTWRAGLVAGAEAALREWGERMDGFVVELARIELETGPLSEQIAALLSEARHARDSEAAARDELAALRTRLAVAEEGSRHRRAALLSARAGHDRLADEQRARAARLAALADELATATVGLTESRADAARRQHAGDELRGRTSAAARTLEAACDRENAAERAAHAASSAVLSAESAHGHSLVELERRQSAAAQLRTTILDWGFGIPDWSRSASAIEAETESADAAVDLWTPWAARWEGASIDELDAAEIQNLSLNRVDQLRGRIRRMGPINPLAIAECDTARARHGFLSTQLADLRSAAESLRQVAAELDRLMRERLAATFQEVAAAFAETFPKLFGGGSARLELTDPQDVAATGIEVLAQPPGKRSSPLSALSGGERALTSVALLFAILKVRPTPFCIMDEVDAALDEANIGRFRNELRDLSERGQFILITHNRATIEAAATIYGVSLGPDTASRVLSLRLEDVTLAA